MRRRPSACRSGVVASTYGPLWSCGLVAPHTSFEVEPGEVESDRDVDHLQPIPTQELDLPDQRSGDRDADTNEHRVTSAQQVVVTRQLRQALLRMRYGLMR